MEQSIYNFGQVISKYLDQKNLTIEDLSLMTSITQYELQKILDNEDRPDDESLRKIADALDTRPARLLLEAVNEKATPSSVLDEVMIALKPNFLKLDDLIYPKEIKEHKK